MHKLNHATVVAAVHGVGAPVASIRVMLFEGCFWGPNGRGLGAPVLLYFGASFQLSFNNWALPIHHQVQSSRLADSSGAPSQSQAVLQASALTAAATNAVNELCDEFSVILGNSLC